MKRARAIALCGVFMANAVDPRGNDPTRAEKTPTPAAATRIFSA